MAAHRAIVSRTLAVAAACVLALGSASGAVAQDASPTPIDIPALEAICARNAADEAELSRCLDVVRTTLSGVSPSPGPVDLATAAAAYLDLVTRTNEASATLQAMWEAAGTDVGKLAEAWVATAAATQAFGDSLRLLRFPPEVQAQVDTLLAANDEMLLLERQLAGAPNDGPLNAAYSTAVLAYSAAAADMRLVLGLPPAMATSEPSAAPTTSATYAIGDWITVQANGAPEVRVQVSKVRTDKYFETSYGRIMPMGKRVYISVFVRYEAIGAGVYYSDSDWAPFVNDRAIGSFTLGSDGPKPKLRVGSLPAGRSAAGWITFDVPAKGRVTLAFGGGTSLDSNGQPFEVVVRE